MTMPTRGCVAVLLAVAVTGGPAAAQTVTSAWARATPGGAAAGAVYMEIAGGRAADRLLGASTPAAAEAMLHESRVVDGVMQMRKIGPLAVPPGGTVMLAPGGMHLMLTGLKAPLRAGEHFPVTLRFEKAGSVTADVEIRKMGAAAPAAMPGMDMKGMDMKGMGN